MDAYSYEHLLRAHSVPGTPAPRAGTGSRETQTLGPTSQRGESSCTGLPRPVAVRINSAGIRTPLEPLVLIVATILAP